MPRASRVEDFFDRVNIRECVDRPKAIHHAGAVLEVVDEATQGVLDKVRQRLPDEFMPLFADSGGTMPG
jgi:uncharacterized protein (DUF2267 family)